MSSETRLHTKITFNRETFNHLPDVKDKLSITNDLIKTYEEKLVSLALMTEPKKFCEDEQDPLWFVNNSVKECIEELEELYITRYKLSLLMNSWDKCHIENGLAIPLPNNIQWDHSFLDGDFVNTVDVPDKNSIDFLK